MSHLRVLVAVALGSAVLAACGTTVPLTSAGTPVADGTTSPVQPAKGATPVAAPSGGTSTVTAPTGGASAATATRGPIATATGSTPLASAVPLPVLGSRGPLGTAPGVTATTIKIGVYTVQAFKSFASSAGVSVATGDQVAQAKAAIAYVNAHGGLAGRTIVPVFHDFSLVAAATNVDSEYAAACSAWTQDQRVYAVVSPVGTVDSALYDCLTKQGVPVISAGDSEDASFFERFASTFYQPTDMNLRRVLSSTVDGLFGAGFFGTSAKIGVIRADNASEAAAVSGGLVPALARHGLKVADTFAVPTDLTGATAYGAAVLRFQADGITHVLFTYMGSPLLFMTSAENQQYRPKYGLHSRNSPGALLQKSAPARQQQGAMGIGWQPLNDVDAAHDPGPVSSRTTLCLSLLTKAGQDITSRTSALIGMMYCDGFLFLQDALRRAPSFTLSGFRAGAESLTSFQSATTFASSFAPGHLHDGATAYRLLAFKTDCGCYQYVSALKAAS